MTKNTVIHCLMRNSGPEFLGGIAYFGLCCFSVPYILPVRRSTFHFLPQLSNNMFVPFISKRSENKLYRRKGGGGKGGGSSSGGAKSSGSSSGSSGSKSSGAGTARSSSISSGGTTKAATSYGSGGGKAVAIPSGQLFAGRSSGGGTRSEVVGTRFVDSSRHFALMLIFVFQAVR